MAPHRIQRNRHRLIVTFLAAATLLTSATLGTATSGQVFDGKPDQVLEWNQVFIDTLIATNTANAASQRLGAIVHTAIFDAYNGIERRYTPVFVHDAAPRRRIPPRRRGCRGVHRPCAIVPLEGIATEEDVRRFTRGLER